MKTLGNILSNQHSTEVSQKLLETEESFVSFLIGRLPVLLLCLVGSQNLQEAEGHLKG